MFKQKLMSAADLYDGHTHKCFGRRATRLEFRRDARHDLIGTIDALYALILVY